MYLQQDVEREMIDLLSKATGAPEMIGVTLPDRWSPGKGVHITVESDGTPVSSRGWTRETLRITVHGKQRSRVSKTMRMVDAFLLSPSSGHFLSIQPGAGILTVPDSKLGGHMSSATYRVAKPRVIFGGK